MSNPGTPNNTRITPWSRVDIIYVIIALSLIGITAVRLVPAYNTLSGTYDEPFHIASGMEWLDKGTYTYERQHPPLARVATAIGPYLMGFRSHSLATATEEGNAILLAGGNYQHTLFLARLGTLPFLILACAVVFLWARRWFTKASGIWALLLFLSLPPILGHAALATLDLACAATLLAALYQLMRWLENPVWQRSIGLGAALSLALLTKFSSIGFLVVCFAVATAYYVLVTAGDRSNMYRQLRPRIGQAFLTVGCVLVFLWAGYRFSLTPLSVQTGVHPSIDSRTEGSPLIRSFAYKVSELPLPLTPFIGGIVQVFEHNQHGHDSYLLGEYRNNGWWYFFPVVVGVKTPIGFLLLCSAGILATLWRLRLATWQQSLTALFPIAIFLFCVTSRIDLGVRHILSIYPLLALMAGHAFCSAFSHRRWRILTAASVLLAGTVVADSWLAHPDYLAYFNQFAGGHPENILVESDLDWGQDLQRLSGRLKSLGVKEVSLRYFGTAPLESAGLPKYRMLSPDVEATGYIAISARFTTLEYAKNGAYGWLKKYTPLERVGKSIFLYHIDH